MNQTNGLLTCDLLVIGSGASGPSAAITAAQHGPKMVSRSPHSLRHVVRRVGRHLLDLALHGRAMRLLNGMALVARLAKRSRPLSRLQRRHGRRRSSGVRKWLHG